jgi:tRNA threonylcarbamoyladenosine biosynthesis protein TsaE
VGPHVADMILNHAIKNAPKSRQHSDNHPYIPNLGAGKTTIAKGIVNGLKAAAPEEVSSPTFTLIHEYGGGRAYHIDLYRLEEAREAATLGLEEIFDRKAVVLIEWGERFPQLIPEEHIEIRLKATSDDARLIDVRELRIEQ